MLKGARVLVVEDEPLIAIDISSEVEAAGGEVIGPFASVASALPAVEAAGVAAAILDVNLVDGEVTPVAMALISRGVDVVVHTGAGLPKKLMQACPDLVVMRKPTPSPILVEALAARLNNRP